MSRGLYCWADLLDDPWKVLIAYQRLVPEAVVAGSTAPEAHARADLYYPEAHLIVEYDGENHRDRIVDDNRRQNLLVNAGYRVLRFTASDVYNRPGAIVAQVSAAVAVSARRPAAATR